MNPPKIGPHLEAEFVRDWQTGMTHRDMVKKYGCASVTITATATRLGLTPRKQVGAIESADLDDEEWRPVVGYEAAYEVSSLGRVRQNKSKRLRRPATVRGYYRISLTRNGTKKSYDVHALVAAAFLGPRPEGLQVCHNNGVKTDLRVENLRYDTPRANSLDTVRHGGNVLANQTHCKQGHPFDAANTHLYKGRHRKCRACGRDRNRKRRAA